MGSEEYWERAYNKFLQYLMEKDMKSGVSDLSEPVPYDEEDLEELHRIFQEEHKNTPDIS